MKWFKHLVGSMSDPDLLESEVLFGSAGPHVFWRTLEILASEDATDCPLVIHKGVYKSRIPSLSWPKIEKILTWFDQHKRISYSRTGQRLTIFCPKLADNSSEYTRKRRRKSGACPDIVQKNTPLEVEEDKLRSGHDWPSEFTINKETVTWRQFGKLVRQCGGDSHLAWKLLYTVRQKDKPFAYAQWMVANKKVHEAHTAKLQDVERWIGEHVLNHRETRSAPAKTGLQKIGDFVGRLATAQ